MQSTINTPEVKKLLAALFADAKANDPLVHKAAKEAGAFNQGEPGFYKAMNKAYMAISAEFGNLMYILARNSKAKTIVEFGTSFGISTIYLAAAIRDNGAGKVITTEFDAGKAGQARQNLSAVGLDKWVEFRVGDALERVMNS